MGVSQKNAFKVFDLEGSRFIPEAILNFLEVALKDIRFTEHFILPRHYFFHLLLALFADYPFLKVQKGTVGKADSLLSILLLLLLILLFLLSLIPILSLLFLLSLLVITEPLISLIHTK